MKLTLQYIYNQAAQGLKSFFSPHENARYIRDTVVDAGKSVVQACKRK